MNNNLTELVFILDRSGSMSGLENDTIGGFNSMLEKQRGVEGDVLISTVLFDSENKVLHDRVDIRNVRNMTGEDYTVGGCTALLDALGDTINHISKVQHNLPAALRPAKTMFVITTDGQENSSRRYTYDTVKKMIQEKQKEYDWEFIFLGANIDAISTAGSLGISADRATNYCCDSIGTEKNYSAISEAIKNYRCAPACAAKESLAGWDMEIKADFMARKGGK